MEVRTASGAVTGLFHQHKNENCQDVTAAKEIDGRVAIAVGDGRSGAPNGLEGANIGAVGAMRALLDEDAWNTKGRNELRSFMHRKLRECYNSVTLTGGSLTDYDATCAAAAMRDDGEYRICSLGDVLVISFDEALNPSIVFWPCKYGDTTFFASMCAMEDRAREALNAMNATGGNVLQEGIAGFAVMTDGADYLMGVQPHGIRYLRQIAATCLLCDEAEADKYLEDVLTVISTQTDYGLKHKDDAALTMMLRVTDPLKAVAAQILLGDESRADAIGESELPEAIVNDVNAVDGISLPDGAERALFGQGVLYALQNGPMTPMELLKSTAVGPGRLLETTYVLTRMGLIEYVGGVFRLK